MKTIIVTVLIIGIVAAVLFIVSIINLSLSNPQGIDIDEEQEKYLREYNKRQQEKKHRRKEKLH